MSKTEKSPLLFTPKQYEMLQMGLTIIITASDKQAKEGEEEDKEEARNRYLEAVELSQALGQNIRHGKGITKERREKFQQRMTIAHKKKDEIGVMRALRDFFTEIGRVEADPAKTIANITMTMIMRSNNAQAGEIFLPIVQKKLAGLTKDYESEGYPSAQEVLIYLTEWLNFGQANMKAGSEPWSNDEHFADKAKD